MLWLFLSTGLGENEGHPATSVRWRLCLCRTGSQGKLQPSSPSLTGWALASGPDRGPPGSSGSWKGVSRLTPSGGRGRWGLSPLLSCSLTRSFQNKYASRQWLFGGCPPLPLPAGQCAASGHVSLRACSLHHRGASPPWGHWWDMAPSPGLQRQSSTLDLSALDFQTRAAHACLSIILSCPHVQAGSAQCHPSRLST